MELKIEGKTIADGEPTYVIAEIGINHNGDLDTALRLVEVAASAGCQAVKFQKRDPEVSTPEAQKSIMRETPWGLMTYLEYKHKVEFGKREYDAIAVLAGKLGIDWFASPWDVPSVSFLAEYELPAVKIASASLTDGPLLQAALNLGVPVILSTGMSTVAEIDRAVARFPVHAELALLHATSTYPLSPDEANLRMIPFLQERYQRLIGYSGHETGLQISYAAVALGARIIERHVTLDRSMWGTDQGASLEPQGLQRLVRDIRVIEAALGDGVKRVYESEVPIRQKLRVSPVDETA
jgi:N-acetylneuraminate synthase